MLDELVLAGRESSNAAVMFHTAMGALLGLTMTEEKTLDLLQRRGPLTAGELAQHSGLAPATISGLIDRLQDKWLVRRVRDARDRRRVIVEINEAQLQERIAGAGQMFGPFIAAMDELYARYSDEELELILGYVTRATAIQREATAGLTGE
ncbi:MarR family transcriptional regulator [Nonomuraea antri]|uniref:MarR family transcriptional regulator n=1 Tax=Nonomuraea antri TaxID=2730852 RepID=UPI001F394155|nr:MarR family transcriptional regulator [Nonomuraea antri]